MDDLQSEKEQIDEMKAWWAEYRVYIIAGVAIAVGGLLGFNHLEKTKAAAQLEASKLYETLAEHVSEGKLDDAEIVADELANSYANTSYAAQSRLAMARLYMDKNRDQDAAAELNELLGIRSSGALKHVGRVRLARILLYQDKAQEVVDLLADQKNEAFAGLYAELRGDAFAVLGEVEAAGDEYRVALADTSQAINRQLVEMKLVDLPEAIVETPPVDDVQATEPAPDDDPDQVVEPAPDDDVQAAEPEPVSAAGESE